jgi:hypothetical protein
LGTRGKLELGNQGMGRNVELVTKFLLGNADREAPASPEKLELLNGVPKLELGNQGNALIPLKPIGKGWRI